MLGLFALTISAAIGLNANSHEAGAPKIIGCYSGVPAILVVLLTLGGMLAATHSSTTNALIFVVVPIGYYVGRLLAQRENTGNPF